MTDQERLPADAERQMRTMSRRSFLWAAAAVAGVAGGTYWIGSAESNNGIPWPLRRILSLNEKVARAYFRGYHLAPEFPESRISSRTNGDLGLNGDVDEATHVVRVRGLHDMSRATSVVGEDTPAVNVSVADVRALPAHTMITELKCIEGWSVIVKWKGARLSDLVRLLGPKTVSGASPDIENRPDDLLPFVGMATPDGEYYVGLDRESALHPQTLVCYEMNNAPLTNEHGAPLRLVIPVKYGVKHLKRIGSIEFTDRRPKDYWAEQGYDWYAGL